MAGNSNIQWTEATWNPIVGCSIKSPGCKFCYAMKDAWRKHHNPALPHYHGLTKKVNGHAVWTGELRQSPRHILLEPLSRRKPTMWFVNSMSDLFHEDVPDAWIDEVFAVAALRPDHTFQVLTKRAERMRAYVDGVMEDQALGLNRFGIVALATGLHGPAGTLPGWPLPNVWLGISAERQQEADERIPHLLSTPAAIRFVSAEPLLGPINLRNIAGRGDWMSPRHDHFDALHPRLATAPLDWIIVGGESGPILEARPFDLQWGRAIVAQCKAADVACFVKQLGSAAVDSKDVTVIAGKPPAVGFKHKKGGDPAEWPAELRVRQFPQPRLQAAA